MKILFSILILSLGCGRVEVGNSKGTSLGSVRTISPVTVNSAEKSQIQSICSAIAQKTTNLAMTANFSYLFNFSQKICGNVTVPAQDANVLLQSNGAGGYSFKNSNGQNFVFPEVETTTTGSMAKICASLTNLQNPIAAGNGNFIWMSTTSTPNCVSNTNQRCIQLETGIPTDATNTSYRIISTEVMKFNIQPSQPNLGFYTDRRFLTNVSCGNNQFSDTSAFMK